MSNTTTKRDLYLEGWRLWVKLLDLEGVTDPWVRKGYQDAEEQNEEGFGNRPTMADGRWAWDHDADKIREEVEEDARSDKADQRQKFLEGLSQADLVGLMLAAEKKTRDLAARLRLIAREADGMGDGATDATAEEKALLNIETWADTKNEVSANALEVVRGN